MGLTVKITAYSGTLVAPVPVVPSSEPSAQPQDGKKPALRLVKD
jgi:hypothetical protein